MWLFGAWADGAVRKLPLYRRLCAAASEDGEVAARLLLSPEPGQRIPNLLLAAVHDVLLEGSDSPLGSWYATVVPDGEAVRPVGEGPDDPWPHFRALALDDPEVAQRLATRATQTNEVGRCAALLPALTAIAAEAGRPLALVEIGASAGLNLVLDRYGYRYVVDGPRPGTEPEADMEVPWASAPVVPDAVADVPAGSVVAEVNAASPLVLECRLRGPGRPDLSAAPPSIVHRIGLDLRPVDLGDPDQARWLLACQWPDQPERCRRARAAIELAVVGEHPEVARGDAVEGTPALLAGVPDGPVPVVVATWVLSYLEAERQRELVSRIDEVGRERDLSFVFADEPGLVPGLPVPSRPDGRADSSATALVRLDWRDGVRTDHRLADLHPHATWMEWLGG
jgi:hypothetical protein